METPDLFALLDAINATEQRLGDCPEHSAEHELASGELRELKRRLYAAALEPRPEPRDRTGTSVFA